MMAQVRRCLFQIFEFTDYLETITTPDENVRLFRALVCERGIHRGINDYSNGVTSILHFHFFYYSQTNLLTTAVI
jgi:hypothetical protein